MICFLLLFVICRRAKLAWMMQLLAVACLSIAAKMEETEVPLILDLQVQGMEFGLCLDH